MQQAQQVHGIGKVGYLKLPIIGLRFLGFFQAEQRCVFDVCVWGAGAKEQLG